MPNDPSQTPEAEEDESARRLERLRSPEAAPYWLSAIIESAEDAIISKTLDSRIASWNSAAEHIFGYTAEEVIGRPVTILIPEDHPDEELSILTRLMRGERIEHYETVRMRKDGTRIDISLTVSPIRGPDGVIMGASKVARDITDRKRAEEERESLLESERRARQEAEEAKRQAEEASQLRDEFLATLSHELRTPLTAVLGWAHVLRTGKLKEEETLRVYETIERNARAQAQLVDDLLDTSRIITGKLRLDVRAVDPAAFVESALESVRPASEAKGIGVRKGIDKGLISVTGDPMRLQQVVWNLLSNAIKFTSPGGSIEIKLERADPNVEISVSDTGAGIPAEFLPHVFDRFRQADQKTTRQHGGLGLGLSIVRHLVEMHGGSVRAESEGEGKGSTFTVVLPAVPVGRDGAPQARTGERAGRADYACPERLDGLRILVVDDEPDTLEVLKVGLSQSGASVLAAGSAAEALAMLAGGACDVLISDIGMPEVDGYELIRRVRALPAEQGGRVPAVALTAYARIEDRLQALRSGFHMHVPKPVELAELIAVTASLVRRGK